MIVGYFLEKEEIEKLRVFEDVIREVEVSARNSCEHLPVESYTTQNPKYCPECGKKVRIHPMEPAIYTKELTGYYKNFFHPKSDPVTVCDVRTFSDYYNRESTKYTISQKKCLYCNRVEDKCECSGMEESDWEEELIEYKKDPGSYPDLSDPSSYVSPKCNENIYSKQSYRNYFVLSNGEKLIFIRENYGYGDIFCIYYDIRDDFIHIDEKVYSFKEKVGKFLEEMNLPLRFGVRSIE